ncbi:putative methyltransferase-domain-containing protein, partial [Sparassis latifolia]
SPTSSLPPLARLEHCSLEQVTQALQNLRSIYLERPPIIESAALPEKHLPKHVIHDTSVPDSGYASAEEDEDELVEDECEGHADEFDVDVLRSDSFERDFVIRWLTGFAARSDVWVASGADSADSDARMELVDAAASLLASFTGKDDEEEEPITRIFAFPGAHPVEVELNDAPLLSTDHTSVGLQSWASAIVLSERICADPKAFSLSCSAANPLRVLELGAGTGLLSIVAAKVFQQQQQQHPHVHPATVLATDFHQSVLANLQTNIDANFPCPPSSSLLSPPCISLQALDWQFPVYEDALASPFDVILAADVVYHPHHPQWIRACVQRLLAPKGVFWLIIALRPTGRHEGMSDTVTEVFPLASTGSFKHEGGGGNLKLAILQMERLGRHESMGRADESGYILYKVGWVSC